MPRAPITLSFWQLGINSLLPPTEIAKQQYAWGENIINRGGIIQTRPGRRPIASVKGKNPQGMCVFKPKGSTPRILAAVDGSVYVMQYPSFVPSKLDGISFSPTAEKVHFCVAIKSSQRNEDNSLKIIEPMPLVVMQDGVSRAAFWDGTTARHLDPTAPARETPIGTWMEWVGSRLWIASGTKIFASDLVDPLSHFEAQYLSGRDAFELSGECTGLIKTANRAGLLAFTETTTTAFKANERDRTQWGSTPEFQDEIIQNVGCVAGRTVCNQYGLTHWMSDKGLVNLDVALATARSSKLVTEDEAMMRSRRKLAPDMSVACAIPYENLLFVSVPAASRYNEHTWVMDQSPLGSYVQAGVWASIWTGTRPVQWASGVVGGRKRLFNLSYDKSVKDDTRIHIWEEMLEDRTDAGGRIKCQWQTGVASGTELMRFKFARFEAMEILGNVDLKVLVAGTRGPWYEIGNYRIQAEQGCFGSSKQPVITSESIIQEFKPQSRTLNTAEFNTEDKVATPEQKPYTPGIDRGFMLCFEWTGRMGIREFTMVFGDGPKEIHGLPACAGDIGEAGQVNAVNEQGLTV